MSSSSDSSSSKGSKLETEFKSVIINVSSAQKLRNVETFGKLDPYLIVKCGKEQVTSPVFNNAGVNPTFNLQYRLKYEGNKHITFIVKDKKSLGRDRECGRHVFCLSSEKISKKQSHQSLELKYKAKKDSGVLNLSVMFDKKETEKSEVHAYKPEKVADKADKVKKIEVPHKFKSLRVVVYRAHNLRDVATLGDSKIDPYTEILIGKQHAKSGVFKDAGVNPKIRTAFVMPYDSERELNIRFFDEGYITKDKPVGSVKVDLMPFFLKDSLRPTKSRGGRMTLGLKGVDSMYGGAVDCRVSFSEAPCSEPTVVQLPEKEKSSSSSSSSS